MCTFKITNYRGEQNIDKHLVLGGPDASNTIDLGGIYVTHHLLHITGEKTIQPVESNGLYYMLLGEIYNYDKSLPSDIFYAIHCYEKYGNVFLEHLDGEFSIIVIDPKNNKIDFFTDPWGTKQLWFNRTGEDFYFGTFPLSEPKNNGNRFFNDDIHKGKHKDGWINVNKERVSLWKQDHIRLQHNSHYTFDTKAKKITHANQELHKWNLDQYKTDLVDVTTALESAIDKRYCPDTLLLLSGGIDSSVIALRLADTEKYIRSATINHNDNAEDREAQSQIIEYCKQHNDNIIFDDGDDNLLFNHQCTLLESMQIKISTDCGIRYHKQHHQSRVILTGNGSDEFFCDYINKRKSAAVTKTDYFPDDLKSIFPWKHFYGRELRRLIDINETKALHYGMEVRMPFFDKHLVQEWLNLTADLKNVEHKHFLKEYLRTKGIKIPTKTAGMSAQYQPHSRKRESS